MHIVLLKIHLEIFLWFVYCAYRTKYIYTQHAMGVYSFWSSFPHFYYKNIFFTLFHRFPLLMRLLWIFYARQNSNKLNIVWKVEWTGQQMID